LIGNYPTFIWGGGKIVKDGDNIFIATRHDHRGLIVIDVSNASDLKEIGNITTRLDSIDIDLIKDKLIVSSITNGVSLIDITDPTDPMIIETHNTPGGAYSQEIIGAFLYVADSTGKLQIFTTTEIPVAVIDSSPLNGKANEGETISFSGSGTDTDGTIVMYEWKSSRDGELNDSASFTTSLLSPGNHTIMFRVQDDTGAYSDWAMVDLHVNTRPNATILTDGAAGEILEVKEGEELVLRGGGDDPDGSVVAYEWRSSRDGVIGTTSEITVSNLSAGKHQITFRTRDDGGAWSEPVYISVDVEEDSSSYPDRDLMLGAALLVSTVIAVVVGLIFRKRRSGQ